IRGLGLPLAVIVLIEMGNEAKAAATAALLAGANDYVIQRGDYQERLLHKLGTLSRHRPLAAQHDSPLIALYVGQDEEEIVNLKHFVLRHAYHIYLEVARSWDEALWQLAPAGKSSEYDLIVLDAHLPGLNVSEALSELYQERKLDIPLLLIA